MAKSARKVARTRTRKPAAKKAAITRKRRTAGRKMAATRTKRSAGRKARSSYKPSDYTTAAPYLIVDGAGGTIDFLKEVLGATELRRFPDQAGRLRHAEVRIGDTVVMLADGVEGWPPQPAHVHVYVADVDATYSRALAAGATSVQEPVKKDDEDKRGGVKDAGGTTWWIATRVG
jgi:PhnB protein